MSDDLRNSSAFDALLFLSFGGPEKVEDVRPFLENVTRGRGVPPERFEDVVQHYLHFGGVSPIKVSAAPAVAEKSPRSVALVERIARSPRSMGQAS